MEQNTLYAAMDQLRSQYLTLDWTYHDITFGTQAEKMYRWPGPEDEENPGLGAPEQRSTGAVSPA